MDSSTPYARVGNVAKCGLSDKTPRSQPATSDSVRRLIVVTDISSYTQTVQLNHSHLPINPRTRRPYRVLPNYKHAAYRLIYDVDLIRGTDPEATITAGVGCRVLSSDFTDPQVRRSFVAQYDRLALQPRYRVATAYPTRPPEITLTYTLDLQLGRRGGARYYTFGELLAWLRTAAVPDPTRGRPGRTPLRDADILRLVDEAHSLLADDRFLDFVLLEARRLYRLRENRMFPRGSGLPSRDHPQYDLIMANLYE